MSRQSKTDISRKQITTTTEGHRFQGSVIRSKTFKESYTKELVPKWCEELTKLSDITKTQLQFTYAAFTSGYKHKFTYYMGTINCISNFTPAVEKIIKQKSHTYFV